MDQRIGQAAAGQQFLVTRDDVIEMGGSDQVIRQRLESGLWRRVHPGVYQVDQRPLDWATRVFAGVLACGPEARASHRAALLLWKMDGISSAPIEVTMPFGNLAVPDGVIVHRTRRPSVASETLGIPVSSPERTLLECCVYVPRIVIAKSLDSAIRMGIVSMASMWRMMAEEAGRGVKGTRRMREVLAERAHDTATDSGSEYELLYYMQKALLPMPKLQHEVFAAGRRIVLDCYWPNLGKAVEVDGVDAHASADKLDDDLVRQNLLLGLGIELRRFSARRIRREPKLVVAEIRQFLEARLT